MENRSMVKRWLPQHVFDLMTFWLEFVGDADDM